MSFYGLYRVLPSFTVFSLSFLRFFCVLPGLMRFYWVYYQIYGVLWHVPSFTEFHRFPLGFDKVSIDIIRGNGVLLGFTGFLP